MATTRTFANMLNDKPVSSSPLKDDKRTAWLEVHKPEIASKIRLEQMKKSLIEDKAPKFSGWAKSAK
jgi:hypothetical protein